MAVILLNSTGGAVALPTVLPALTGPYAGTHWRLEAIVTRDGVHHLRATRPHRQGRHVIVAHPATFGLVAHEVITAARHLANHLHRLWSKVDDGLIMGVLALIPLALFEAFHGGEATRHVIEMLFGPEGGH